MATPARLAGVGVFVLGGLLLFAVGLFMIGDRQMAFAKKFTVYTEFKKITGLQPGAIVRVSRRQGGIDHGDPAAEHAEREVPREARDHRGPASTGAHRLAGDDRDGRARGRELSRYRHGNGRRPARGPNATIAGKEPFDIADLMQQMGDTIKKVNDTFDEMKADVQGTVVAIGDTVDNANALIVDVSDDLKQMAASGARICQRRRADRRRHSQREGHDRQARERRRAVQPRATAIAKQAEDIADEREASGREARTRPSRASKSKDGPVQGMTASVKQTMDDARAAMEGFAENMDALKHNFLLRGFFKKRGYFDLAQMSPADYRQGALTKGSDRRLVRVWRRADVLFEPEPDHPENVSG